MYFYNLTAFSVYFLSVLFCRSGIIGFSAAGKGHAEEIFALRPEPVVPVSESFFPSDYHLRFGRPQHICQSLPEVSGAWASGILLT